MAVALKLPLQLPTVASPFPINIILFPPNPLLRRHGNSSSSSSTELRFSRWNNANAEPFLRRRRLQEEIETDLRLRRRYQSISNLTETDDSASPPPSTSAADFKSNGTPSSPSRRSIPGRRSKYSKPPDHTRGHPAFSSSRSRVRFSRPPAEAGIVMGDKGLAYKVEGAPFEFQYSYTETPKVKPLALREAPFLPFGPTTMPRPWTGRAPLPPSKKKLPEFDSFKLPPPGKKGVKPVQAPGPYLSGSGPKYVATREEVIGDPLTKEEVKDLIKGCLKTRRQLNMGRDGLTHNMLDNIHAHWKRRRVCKIKCKGVCTVDMDNVSEQLEEKTGGKIIYCRGGAIFLFRGRNYNYRTRPRYPLMLWKPITPVYPRLVARAPEGLTLEEAADMRKRGRQLPPICKLGKNGVYTNLVKNVKEAFEACELVRIDCTGLNRSDCRKIGAKLKDLVPCVLISFEYEHILIWRGKYWNSSLPPQEDIHNKAMELGADDFTTTSSSISLEGEESSDLHAERSLNKEVTSAISNENITKLKDVGTNEDLDLSEVGVESVTDNSVLIHQEAPNENLDLSEVRVESVTDNPVLIHQEAPNEDLDLSEVRVETVTDNSVLIHEEARDSSTGESSDEDIHPVLPLHSISLDEASSSEIKDLSLPMPCMDSTSISSIGSMEESKVMAADSQKCSDDVRSEKACLDGIMLLLRQAVENGSALILDDEPLDANIVYERCIALARRAPPGPVFQHGFRRIAVQKKEKGENKDHKEQDLEVEAITIPEKRSNKKEISRSTKREDFGEVLSDVIPHGSLRVDELAKLLA